MNQCGVRIPWDDETLVRVLEELREKANGHAAALKVVSVPDDVQWGISKVDGVEHVSKAHPKLWFQRVYRAQGSQIEPSGFRGK